MNDLATATDNPLLPGDGLPLFDRIQAGHVQPALDQVLRQNRARIRQLLSVSDPDWTNFIAPMEALHERLSRMWSPVSHLNSVCDSTELRQAYEQGLPKLTEYYTEVAQDESIYRCYRAVAERNDFSSLEVAQRKIIDNALRDFHLAGVDLEPGKKARFKEIQQQLSQLGNKFEQNVLDATTHWALWIEDKKDLRGLPPATIDMSAQAAEQDGGKGWKFTLQAPSYVPFLTYADDGKLRHQMYTAFVTRASDQGPKAGMYDNTEIIQRILQLRKETSQLLGFQNYVEYSLATKMAENMQQVMDFLHKLAERSHRQAQAELEELKAFAREHHGVESLDAWDIAYYSEKLRSHRYAFTQEEVRPYFPLAKVLQGMFEIVQRLYGIQIQTMDNPNLWQEDVRMFEICDEHGYLRGQFYIDLYARTHKRGGAWMDSCIDRKRTSSGVQAPVAFLNCNFSPPVGRQQSLLTHDEVITLFHEFGHGLHHMLTQVDHIGVSGINGVPWDAVELPSQFHENWCWQSEALALISGHVDTGAPLPEVLLDKMKAARNFQAGMQMVRQLEFALFDMRLHSEFDPDTDASIQDLLDEVRREVAVIVPPTFNRFQHGFSHIFAGGYGAGYYSYKWAEVLSADAFSKFEEKGIFDVDTGREFLHNILEQGGSREPMDLFTQFRGREPSIDALLRHNGLAA